MEEQKKPRALQVALSPHLHSRQSTQGIMLDVLIALLPAVIAGILYYGLQAFAVVLAAMFGAVLIEHIACLLMHKRTTIIDGSAAVTGLLVGLNMPAGAPVWLAVVGSGIAIIVIKVFFGGLGYNMFNPALAARAIMLVSWPQFMTAFAEPFTHVITGATPLGAFKAAGTIAPLGSMFMGDYAGLIGETSALALIIGFAYLIFRRVIDWKIPVSYVATVGVLTALFGGDGLSIETGMFHMLAGGLLLGAIFMATDPVTSPVTPTGRLVMGIGAGVLTTVFRLFGGAAEGVSYAILLMNALTPLIDRYTQPRRFGVARGLRKQGV